MSIDSSSSSKVFNVTNRIRFEVFHALPPADACSVPGNTDLECLLASISTTFNSTSSQFVIIPTSLLSAEGKTKPSSQHTESICSHCIQMAKDQPSTSTVEALQFYASSESQYVQICKIFGKLSGTRVRSQSHTTHDYYKKSLNNIDAVGYKAAGLILYRKNSELNEYEFLLGQTRQELTTLGGKIDSKVDHSVYDTAVREFNEETSLLLEPQWVDTIRAYLKGQGEGSRVMWYSGGKFALCFLSVEEVPGLYEATESLPQRMADLRGDSERWAQLPSSCREMDGLRWISTSDFKALESKQLSKFLGRMKTSIGFEAWLGSLKGSVEYPKFAERFRSNTV